MVWDQASYYGIACDRTSSPLPPLFIICNLQGKLRNIMVGASHLAAVRPRIAGWPRSQGHNWLWKEIIERSDRVFTIVLVLPYDLQSQATSPMLCHHRCCSCTNINTYTSSLNTIFEISTIYTALMLNLMYCNIQQALRLTMWGPQGWHGTLCLIDRICWDADISLWLQSNNV